MPNAECGVHWYILCFYAVSTGTTSQTSKIQQYTEPTIAFVVDNILYSFRVAYYVLPTHHLFCRNSSLAMTHMSSSLFLFVVSPTRQIEGYKNSFVPLFANSRCFNATSMIEWKFFFHRKKNDQRKTENKEQSKKKLLKNIQIIFYLKNRNKTTQNEETNSLRTCEMKTISMSISPKYFFMIA